MNGFLEQKNLKNVLTAENEGINKPYNLMNAFPELY